MDKKIILAAILFTIVAVIGGVFYSSGAPSKAAIEKTQGAKVEIKETSFNFKDVPYSGGKAIHAFYIKNAGNKDLQIANLATSCMCTITFFQSGREKSPEFGMKGMTQSSSWKGLLRPAEEGKIVTVFDPAYHGPQGIGPISRIVSFETNDPDHPYIELSFSGTVVK